MIDDKIEVEVQEKYLRTDTYRSSGAGGQHVNKTDSAVRMTYQTPDMEQPVVAAVQSERSQHQNRAKAMSMLKARLYEIELAKREAVTDAMNATKTDIGWGHQIRSYVLQPYQMVKDLRTGVETSQYRQGARRRYRRIPASLAGAAHQRRRRRGRRRTGRLTPTASANVRPVGSGCVDRCRRAVL